MKKISIVLIMLIVAIVAVGSVSAADNATADIVDISTDEVAVDDVALEENDDGSVENDDVQLPSRGYDVDDSMSSSYINNAINSASTGSHVVNFTPGTYNSMALVLKDNVALYGNGATIYGNGNDPVFTIAGCTNFTITGFNIIVNSTTKDAIRGANVVSAVISNNTITGGNDGINIYQTYSDVTIIGNKFYGVDHDAISLVNHRTFDDDEWDDWIGATVSDNIINGPSEYGMFFGGNFKGTISNNAIDNVTYGIEFAGKKAVTNGQLRVNIYGNNITNVTTGINMFHPCVRLFNMTNNNIYTINPSVNYAIYSNSNFAKAVGGRIIVINNTLEGLVSEGFINATNTANGNDGIGAYIKP